MQKNAHVTSVDTHMAMTYVAAIYLVSAGSSFLSNLSFTFSPTAPPKEQFPPRMEAKALTGKPCIQHWSIEYIYTKVLKMSTLELAFLGHRRL